MHASDTRRAIEPNFGQGGMKRLVEEAAACYADAIHYSALARIWLGGTKDREVKDLEFWPSVLESLSGVWLRREETDALSNGSERSLDGMIRSKKRPASWRLRTRIMRFW